eukprot:15444921-Alexandrium_andersonii.AAC.1
MAAAATAARPNTVDLVAARRALRLGAAKFVGERLAKRGHGVALEQGRACCGGVYECKLGARRDVGKGEVGLRSCKAACDLQA